MSTEYDINQTLNLGGKSSLRSVLENIEYAIKQSYYTKMGAQQTGALRASSTGLPFLGAAPLAVAVPA